MRLTSMTSASAIILPALAVAQAPAKVSSSAQPLDPYISCSYSYGLSVTSTVRLPGEGLRHRTVETAKGKREVSVIDGYRLMLSQGEPSYFANMKIEKSDPRQYASDKDAVIKNLEFMTEHSTTGKHQWDHMPYNGFDVYGLMDPTIDANGPNGVYLLFRDSAQTIVTIYFLGQPPEHRKFKTIENHDALVDKMLEELTTCANTPASVAASGSLPPLRTTEDLRAFITHYYLRPRVDRIAEVIKALSSSGALLDADVIGPITGFLTEIFLTNPSRAAEWQPLIDRQSGLAKSTLDTALSWSKKGGVLQLEVHSPRLNDMYWGAFFAAGNPMYVKKLLDVVPFSAQLNDANLWYTGAAAKWSLATFGRENALVRSILEGEKRTADKRTQDLIDELLTRDPARIRQDMIKIYERQKAAGKWK